MIYEKQSFVDKETILEAEHLNHMEEGIYQNSLANEYDLVIPIDMVSFESLSEQDIGDVNFNDVSNAIEKLVNGEIVKVVIRALVNMDSGNNLQATIYPTSVRLNYAGRMAVDFLLPMDENSKVVYCHVEIDENTKNIISTRSFIIDSQL